MPLAGMERPTFRASALLVGREGVVQRGSVDRSTLGRAVSAFAVLHPVACCVAV